MAGRGTLHEAVELRLSGSVLQAHERPRLQNDDFLPLGNGVQFNGSFDGNGKKLLNVNYIGSSTDKTSVNYGLFGTLGYDGMVSDLTLASGTISCFQYAGGIAAISYGNIVNCTNSAAVSTLANPYAAASPVTLIRAPSSSTAATTAR